MEKYWEHNHDQRTKSVEERFWEKVNILSDDECWEWQGTGKRYGRMKIYGKSVSTHRFSYELHFGEIPNGLYVCHTCDNPKCVNPNHLFLGTALDNNQDKTNKGRFHNQNGSKNPNAKFTKQDVLSLRELYATGKYSIKELAEMFGISRPHTSGILNRKFWKHI